METVFYVGYYGTLVGNKRNRNYSLAAAKKMDFIATAIRDIGFHVNIVSPAYITDKESKRVAEMQSQLSDGITLTLTPSFGAKNKIQRVIRVLQSKIWLFLYLMRNTTRNSKVFLYHNYEIANPILFAQKLKGFKLILEIEEQYSMVWKLSFFQKRNEDRLLRVGKKGSLVVSEVLAEKLGIEDPIVSYGNYNAFVGDISVKPKREKIRLIYTGSIDKVKNSAYMALAVMPNLPENYELKLSGPIAKGEEQFFKQEVEKINHICGRSACEYLGVLGDKEYSELLCSADIALNLQQDGEFGQFLFPSKILTYLSYNIPVVSTRGASIIKSSVANLIAFTDGYDEESIARAITTIDITNEMDRRIQLKRMSDTFKEQMRALLYN